MYIVYTTLLYIVRVNFKIIVKNKKKNFWNILYYNRTEIGFLENNIANQILSCLQA